MMISLRNIKRIIKRNSACSQAVNIWYNVVRWVTQFESSAIVNLEIMCCSTVMFVIKLFVLHHSNHSKAILFDFDHLSNLECILSFSQKDPVLLQRVNQRRKRKSQQLSWYPTGSPTSSPWPKYCYSVAVCGYWFKLKFRFWKIYQD